MPLKLALFRIAAVLLPAAMAVGVASPATAQTPQIQPYLNCIDLLPLNRVRAHFGYVSTYPTDVTLEVGVDNFFTPGILNRGQPTVFHPGFHDRAVTTEWQLNGATTQISWVLQQNLMASAGRRSALLCGVRSRGEWDASATYVEGDLIRYNGALFVNALAEDICPDEPFANSYCWLFYAPTPPVISAIPDQTTPENVAIKNIPFTLSHAGNIWNLTVLATSTETTLLPLAGITVQGSGANRTVSLNPASNRTGTAIVTLYVSDGVSVAIESFTVNVTGKEN